MKTLNNYFVKTMKQKNPTLQAGIQKMLLHGVFLGILTISIHMLLQTLADTILSIQFSEFMAPSYASVYLTYTTLSFYFFLLFFAIHYEQFSFYGLYHNRLYFMTQLGFSPMIILLQKYLAIMSITIIIYTSGYVCTVIISLLL